MIKQTKRTWYHFARLMVCFLLVIFLAPMQASANDGSVVITDLIDQTNNKIKKDSSSRAVFQIDIAGKPGRKLTDIIVQLNGTGFSQADLKSINDSSLSGVSLYQESESLANGFDSNDSLVILDSSSDWYSESEIYLFLKNSISIGTSKTFYLTIQTAAASSADHEIRVTIVPGGVILSDDGAEPLSTITSSAITIDSIQPTVEDANLVNPISVDVKFSEAVKEILAKNASNYTFNNEIAIHQVDKISDNVYRIISSKVIPTEDTTLTISPNITDIAGNLGVETVKSITYPINVRISELATRINGEAWSEFIELYNSGSTRVNIGGWMLQYSTATSESWSTKVTLPANTYIEPYSYYLIGSAKFYGAADMTCPASTLDYCKSVIGLTDEGGHIRLFTGTKEADKLGWGSAEYAESFAASALSDNESLERKAFGTSILVNMISGGKDESMGNGWDADNNALDFVKRTTINPQSSASPTEQPNFSNYGGQAANGPMIKHMPINIAKAGSDLDIFIQASDPRTPTINISSELHYAIDSGTGVMNHLDPKHYHIIGSRESNGYFKFTIPQAHIDDTDAITNGILYHLQVLTNNGETQLSADPLAITHEEAESSPLVIKVEDSSAWGDTSTISGTIVDEQGAGISNALVFAEGTGASATTDSSGNYTLDVKNNRPYNLVISKDNYFEESISDIFVGSSNITGQNKVLYTGTGGGSTGDNTKPIIVATFPTDSQTGVPPKDSSYKIFVVFSEDIDSTLFTTSNVVLSADQTNPINNPVAGYTVVHSDNHDDNVAYGFSHNTHLGVITVPSEGLEANKTYTLIISGNIRDMSGNSIVGNNSNGNYTITFTTGADFSTEDAWTNFGQGNMTPPRIIGVTPSDGMSNIAPNTKINISFSDPMDTSSITASGNIKLLKTTISDNVEIETLVSSTVSIDSTKKNITITPSSNLIAGSYKIIATGALKSASGIPMGDPNISRNTANSVVFASRFKVNTTSVVDSTRPTILGTWPANNATNISINPGSLILQFSEGINPTTINSNTISLLRGTSQISGNINYNAETYSLNFIPSQVLAPNANYALKIIGGSNGLADMVGNYLASSTVVYFQTNSTLDTIAPKIMFSNADDNGVAITFSEPMNASTAANTQKWSSSVLNLTNYKLRWGDAETVVGSGTNIDLSTTNSSFTYDAVSNTVVIKNLGLQTANVSGKNIYVDMASANVDGSGATDLSGNILSGTTSFQAPIQSSSSTKGELVPNSSGEGATLSMSDMGIMKAGAIPMNALASQITTYFVNLPTNKQIKDNYKILLTFPKGFNINNAKKDVYSPANNDLNEVNSGTVSFSTEAETSGGANNDGVTIDTSANIITVDLGVTGTTPIKDYLHFDLAGIVNSSIPRGPDTGGYSVDMKILDENGYLSETIAGLPFFIKPAGSASLSGNILGINPADTDGSDTIKIYLDSPTTGPLETIVSLANDGTGNYSFSSLPLSNYQIFTDQSITLDSSNADYIGISAPEPITISAGVNPKNITFKRADAGSVAAITVNITGIPNGENVDIVANSPELNITKKVTGTGGAIAEVLYLKAGIWKIQVLPAREKITSIEKVSMPNWVAPRPINVESDGSSAQSFNLTLTSTSKEIVGFVLDGAGVGISNAQVNAYQPNGTTQGSYTTTDTDGKFILKLANDGDYSVGVFKAGLPIKTNKNVKVKANDINNVDGNATADVYENNALITAANKLIFKIIKPSYTISGKVTDGTNAVILAPIWATKQDGLGQAKTITDSSGNYILYVDNGTWSVEANIPEFGLSTTETVTINGENQTLNITPDTTLTYYTISGTITVNNEVQANTPVRALKYTAGGELSGEEYIGQTNSSGMYSIKAPAGIYRIDTWTASYGEIERTDADDYPASPANLNLSANTSGVDVTLASGALNTVTLAFTNGLSSQEAIINIDSTTNEFHKNIKLSTLASNAAIKLKNGTYLFHMHIPGIGSIEPATNPVTFNGDSTVTFVLPDSATEIFTLTGTITDTSGPIENAWVWVGNEALGDYLGDTTDATGAYSITVKNGNYKTGVEATGYIPQPPTAIVISADTAADYELVSANRSITGTIYNDLNSDTDYDAGEEVLDGWVWVEDTINKKRIGATTKSDGTFSIPVVDSTYRLKAVADGYSQSTFGTITISGSDSNSNNIRLTPIANWDTKLKAQSITPSSGGSLDNSGAGGSGIRIIVPPNALGSEATSGSITSKEVSNVSQTSTASPLGGIGKEITANDSSGAAITNLSNDIEIELVYYKDEISAALSNYAKLSTLTNSYWDTSLSNWVAMSTTKTAYTKADVNDTDWTTVTDFSAFATALAGNANTYADYKIALNSNTDHLTIFGATTPTDSTAPDAPTGLSQTAGNGTSVTINWADNVENDLLEYEVYRATSTGVTADIANQVNGSQVTASNFTDATTAAFTVYYYTVTAADDSGNESVIATELQLCSNSTVANGSIDNNCVITCNLGFTKNGNFCADVTAPIAPTNLSQTSGTGTTVVLNWDDNTEPDLAKYNIYRDAVTGFTASSTNMVNVIDITTSTFTDATTAAFTVYYYQITALDTGNNESATSTEIQVCSNKTVNNGSINNSCVITCDNGYELSGNSCNAIYVAPSNNGGGGGGGGYVSDVAPTYQVYDANGNLSTTTVLTTNRLIPAWQAIVDKANALARLTIDAKVAEAASTESKSQEQANTSDSDLIKSILSEAKEVFAANIDAFVAKFNTKRNLESEALTNTKYISELVKKQVVSDESKTAMNEFITYGTFTTLKLGAGERAGAVSSFKSAFDRLPTTLTDWEDVIKIANGRWTNQRNAASEERAIQEFKTIYKRVPDRINPHDDAAVTIIAYGLRPTNRNLDSEKAAIKSFKNIYKGNPKSALAWDIVRAIAYSGAKR
ncbi:carboxypeptidase regulatory-like domain-containing protein [Patescibacteria group bacterium]|nr:carboxypeptidase regulatory-like domain-containing protein [Patescibacteria group bacterium]